MGNGSTKPGDAKADQWRDRFRQARNEHRQARESFSEEEEITATDHNIQTVLTDSKSPNATRGVVGILAVFPEQHRVWAFVVLALLILGLVALGAAKWLGAFG